MTHKKHDNCVDCGRDISDRKEGCRLCVSCLQQHKIKTNAKCYRKHMRRHKFRCNRCGTTIGGDDIKYCRECSVIVDKEKHRIRNERYRKRHRRKLRTRSAKYREEHADRIHETMSNFIKRHKEEWTEKVRQWRELNPDKWQAQKDKEKERQQLLRERKGQPGYCPQCGRDIMKSSILGLCQRCLFERSFASYNKKLVDPKQKQKQLRDRFEHLIPDGLDDDWVDEYIDIIYTKVRLKIITESGEKTQWTSEHINNLFSKYYSEPRLIV